MKFAINEKAMFGKMEVVIIVNLNSDTYIVKRSDDSNFNVGDGLYVSMIAVHESRLCPVKKVVSFHMSDGDAAKLYALLNHVGLGRLVGFGPDDTKPFREAIKAIFPWANSQAHEHWVKIAGKFS
jgi:hypothetical protein